jgi:phage terminase large subunit
MPKPTTKKRVEFPRPFQDIFRPARYKVWYGGRGAAKSWCVARGLLLRGTQQPIRILCTREYQSSITDSVHKLLSEQISALDLDAYYDVQRARVLGSNGTEFIFKGLHHNIQEIKSTEGVDICWVEEAQSASEESWKILIPTIRKDGSEIWLTFNPLEETDPTYQRFVTNPPPGTVIHKVSWRDNPWFPKVLNDERRYLLSVDPDAYGYVWEGETRHISEAVIFKGKYSVRSFETPADARLYFGADWGFAQDPTMLIRCWVDGTRLMIDHEAFGIGIDIDNLAKRQGEPGRSMFDEIPESRKWPIYADCARPETISYVRQRGFRIDGADKWPGSVEDGIAFLRSFQEIIIHERCVHMAQEARTYKYKVDPLTGDVLPKIEDKNNHGWDALRYALHKLIKGKAGGRIVVGGKRVAPSIGRM